MSQSLNDLAEGRRSVNHYIRTINTLSLGPSRVRLSTLELAHRQLDSILHLKANEQWLDVEAIQYVMKRLPPDILYCNTVVMGSSLQDFERFGYTVENEDRWHATQAEARRRICLYDGKETLACFAASISDEYDLLPSLMALQIEWNKLHILLTHDPETMRIVERLGEENTAAPAFAAQLGDLRIRLHLTPEEWQNLAELWSAETIWSVLRLVGRQEKHFWIRRLGGSHIDYARTALNWILDVEKRLEDANLSYLLNRDIYFVSANVFSIPFLLTGFVKRYRQELVDFVLNSDKSPELAQEYREIHRMSLSEEKQLNLERNLLAHASREWRGSAGKDFEAREMHEEELRGIWRLDPKSDLKRGMQVGFRIIDIPALHVQDIDQRCKPAQSENLDFLKKSEASIILIDYPLGRAAHRILHVIQERLSHIRGIYILGKAGTLNGKVGDIMLPNSIFDLHSGNSYWFSNEIDGEDVMELLHFGSVFSNQRGVSVESTILQNEHFLDFYYDQGYTCIETESGSFLEAVYEGQASEGHPFNNQIHFDKLPFKFGIVYYASDTPYTREQTLAKTMGYYGADSLYASSAAVVRSIFYDIEQRQSNSK